MTDSRFDINIIPPSMSPDDEFVRLIGAEICSGSFRTVYYVSGRSDLVIKVSKMTNQANCTEYRTYQTLLEKNDTAIVGRIESISQTGKYLIMEYLSDITFERIVGYPRWLTDRKTSAFGESSTGIVKVRDYGEVKSGFDLNCRDLDPAQPQDQVDEMRGWLSKVK